SQRSPSTSAQTANRWRSIGTRCRGNHDPGFGSYRTRSFTCTNNNNNNYPYD
ncbi:hypothetical protein HK102_006225, partial [Quaeritorhiza haematococci]